MSDSSHRRSTEPGTQGFCYFYLQAALNLQDRTGENREQGEPDGHPYCHKPRTPQYPGALLRVDAAGGKGGRRENRDRSGHWGLGIQEVLAQYKAPSELGRGLAFQKVSQTLLSSHTQAARTEVKTQAARLECSGDLCLTGDCVIWWVVLAVHSTLSLSAVNYCFGRTPLEAMSPLLRSLFFITLDIA